MTGLIRWIGPTVLIATLGLSGQGMATGATSIELFATQAQLDAMGSLPASVKTYAIDGLTRFEQSLSQSLPNDLTQATAMAEQTLRDLTTEERQALQHLVDGQLKQQQYRLDRYPAIVFDGQAIVYGTTDILRATGHYRSWQANR
jgi:integrating conjugative element protein (TIGR03757 family)